MALISAAMQHCVVSLALSHIFITSSFLTFTVEAADDYIPHTAAAGVLENEYLHGSGYSSEENGRTIGDDDDDPDHITNKALLCFNDKNIYSGCEEAYRLSQAGELHVPPEYTDQFCNGACLKETYLVLNCVGSILSRFVFYNKATIKDVKDTVKEACSLGSKRGNFDVERFIQGDESSALQASGFMVHCLVSIIVAWCFLI
ncbi:PREDICTED: uncharacterized protein LOC109170082 [Ipomoea nil]|uniref:uncharacterized protein LOC109170082 n=1 Tax=Ipomoea nil TaxID=35883 RepID=UPI000901C573|nr:PREDICTED: uncharacterized protein LOC109170082 [Ipomoea nil]